MERFPTAIGVNFYQQGDLLDVVDHLNRTGTVEDRLPRRVRPGG